MARKNEQSDVELKAKLTPEQYEVTQKKGTERAFTGAHWDNHDEGVYRCIACNEPIFASESKFDSGCGWPSFTAPLAAEAVEEHVDGSFGMRRTEVVCQACGAHLGHVFDDGPGPTHLRYCINSASLAFEKEKK